jgi:hypothetical protein
VELLLAAERIEERQPSTINVPLNDLDATTRPAALVSAQGRSSSGSGQMPAARQTQVSARSWLTGLRA